ncbi:hypothetical protein LTR94_037217, partial [Friedmanniomyces endolithicus]
DTSGAILAERIGSAGHEVAGKALVPDEVAAIRAQVRSWIEGGAVDAIITTGGTGLTGRDVTPEATLAVATKEMPGFGEQMRQISLRF